MPYPSEHAARQKSPEGFIRFRRRNNAFGEGIDVIYGITSDGKAQVQTIRFDASKFSPGKARAWLKSHGYKTNLVEATNKSEDVMTDELIAKALSLEVFMNKVHYELMKAKLHPMKTYMNAAIVGDESGNYYLLKFSVNTSGEVTLDARENWVDVEEVWVAKQLGEDSVPEDIIFDETVTVSGDIEKANWKVGVARNLPVVHRSSWDGAAAKARIFSWAGWPDNPKPSQARRAFLLYDASEPELKGSYKDPIADVVDGRLVAIDAAFRAAASRLPQTSAPSDVISRAQAALRSYQNKVKKDDEIEKEWAVNIIEKDDEKRIAYGVVYGPRSTGDTQGDLMEADEVEKMAHSFLARKIAGMQAAMDWQHEEIVDLHDAIPVESYIAPQDFSVNGYGINKGDWVLATHIPDEEKWEMVKSGEIKAYSIRGKGKRTPVE